MRLGIVWRLGLALGLALTFDTAIASAGDPVVPRPPPARAQARPHAPSAPPPAAVRVQPEAPVAKNRFHVLTPDFAARLAPPTQVNAGATARWGESATAFLVHRQPTPDGPDRALLLTNEHVASSEADVSVLARGPGHVVTFPDGSKAKTVRILSSSRELDYALVEVELPAAARVEPVVLRREPPRAAESVYAVSAFVNIDLPGGPETGVKVTDLNRRFVEAAMQDKKSIPSIQTGTLKTALPRVITFKGGKKVTVVDSDLPNRPGGSGSPVFSREDHRVLALHSGGGGEAHEWQSTEVPMYMILSRVAEHLREGKVPADARDLAEALLTKAAAPAPPAAAASN